MNLKDLEKQLKPHKTSRKEIQDMLEMIKRDLEASQLTGLSEDWQFSIAYNAVRLCCLIPLYCKGFKIPSNITGQHHLTIESLTYTLGNSYKEMKKYLDTCRVKRNKSDYDTAGIVSSNEVRDLVATTNELYKDIKNWLKDNYPQYI